MNLKDGKGRVPIRNRTNDHTPWLLVDFPSKKVFKAIYSKHRSVELIDKYHKILVSRAKGKTLAESGAPFGITRERVRQIEARFQRLVYHKYWEQTDSALAILGRDLSVRVLTSMPDSL